MQSHYRLIHDRRAIDPVIATVILVGVTVAIAVLASLWMGALTGTYERTEELTITSVSLSGNTATFYVTNKGTSDVIITRIQASGPGIPTNGNSYNPSGSGIIMKGTTTSFTVTITFTGGATSFQKGSWYQFVVVTSQAHLFPATALA